MKRTVVTAMIAGGLLSALVGTAPTVTAAPSNATGVSCAEYSALQTNARQLVIEDLLKTRTDHIYKDKPATARARVDSECKKQDNTARVKVETILESFKGSADAPSSNTSTAADTACSAWLKMKRPEQAELMKQLIDSSSKFYNRYNTASALVDGECAKNDTVGAAWQAVTAKHGK